MEFIFNDRTKIKLFAQIQVNLSNLEPNSDNEQIDKIIEEIPQSYLEDKEDLMTICRIFAIYSRNKPKIYRQNALKLFEKIITPIKKHLQNEPIFIWNLFGSLNYFKQWMYEEGLITIDIIIESAVHNNSMTTIEYFLPEIIEQKNELFENEFKKKIRTPYSKEYIDEFKITRKKYFNWLRESNNINDPIYSEIETNQLRLAIKTDNVDKFQTIISNSNISLDSKIKESIIEQSFISDIEETLLEFAIDWNATNIIKYLLMNNAKFSSLCTFNSIYNGNYEMIHIAESMDKKENFSENLFFNSIECWNMELTQYAIDNYDFEFIEQENVESDKDEKIRKMYSKICCYMNFEFFEKMFLPFLHKNQRFLKDNIHSLLIHSFFDQSLYFMKEILKYPNIDINYQNKEGNDKLSILTIAVQMNNFYAVDLLLKYKDIDIEKQNSDKFLPFLVACVCKTYTAILEAFFKNPKFDIYSVDGLNFQNGFVYCALQNNFCGLKSIIDHFPDFKEENVFNQLLDISVSKEYLTTTNLLIKYFINLNNDMPLEELWTYIKSFLSLGTVGKIYQSVVKIYNEKNGELDDS